MLKSFSNCSFRRHKVANTWVSTEKGKRKRKKIKRSLLIHWAHNNAVTNTRTPKCPIDPVITVVRRDMESYFSRLSISALGKGSCIPTNPEPKL